KAAGAMADTGATLERVADAARHANARTRSIGVGLGPCTVPTAGRPTFELPEGEMEIGMGVHGEVGIGRTSLATADEVAQAMLAHVLDDFSHAVESVVVVVNTLGATPLMEGYVFLHAVDGLLREQGVRIHRSLVGEYVTS